MNDSLAGNDALQKVEKEIEALKKAEGITPNGIHWWLIGIMTMISRAVEQLSPIGMGEKISKLYYQAEAAYRAAAEKVDPIDPDRGDHLRQVSVAYLTLAHQYELVTKHPHL